MTRRWRTNVPEMQQAARRLRRAMTPAEAVLWQAVRGHRVDGFKIRRQYAVGRFVLDFYCPARKLGIELDGGVHDACAQQERDAERTAVLELYGIRVVRFRNEEVIDNLPAVLTRIRQELGTLPSAEDFAE